MAAVRTFYHALVVIYQQWINYIMVTTIIHINNTEPEVIAFVGQLRGVQFLTLWAQMMQQAFFCMALRADIAEMTGDMQLCAKLRRWADFVFKFGAVPLTALVCVNFWVLYAVLDWPLAETNFIKDYMPPLLNHGMHTVVFFLNLGELIVTPRQFPLQKGIFRVTALVLTYSVWTYITKMISGRWPYVFMKDLSNMEQFSYVMANAALAVLCYVAAGAFNKRLWNQHEKNEYQKRK